MRFEYKKNKSENILIYTVYDENNEIVSEKQIPIRDENGNFTDEFLEEIIKMNVSGISGEIKEEQPVAEVIDTEEIADEELAMITDIVTTTELATQETGLAIVNFEDANEGLIEKKPGFLQRVKNFAKKAKKPLYIIAGACGVIALLHFIPKFKGCGKEDNKEIHTVVTPTPGQNEKPEVTVTPTVTPIPTATPTPVPTVEELKEDSRHTKITKEDLEKTVNNVVCEFKSHDIELNGEDVLNFVTLANLTHIQKTNPELLASIMGEEVDADLFISKAAKIISQIVTLEVTPKNETIDWSICFMDETDKQIAKYNIKNVLFAVKMYAEGTPIKDGGTYATREEKAEYIKSVIRKEYIDKVFSATPEYKLVGGKVITVGPEIGAEFIINAIVSGILNNDIEIKQYQDDKEIENDLNVIAAQKDVFPILKTLIKSIGTCIKEKTIASVELYGEKILFLKR